MKSKRAETLPTVLVPLTNFNTLVYIIIKILHSLIILFVDSFDFTVDFYLKERDLCSLKHISILYWERFYKFLYVKNRKSRLMNTHTYIQKHTSKPGLRICQLCHLHGNKTPHPAPKKDTDLLSLLPGPF